MGNGIWIRRAAWVGLVAAAAWGSGAMVCAQSPPGAVPHGAYFGMGVAQAESSEPADVLIHRPGDYWIGVECYPASETLHAQLELPEGQGLVVEQVLPESPGAKAGIKRHDILLTAGDKPLGEVGNLIEAINAAKDKELSIKAIRGGKPVTLTVKPAKRPEGTGPVIAPFPGGDMEAIKKWLEQVKPGEGKGSLQFRVFQPGVVTAPGAMKPEPLPEGVSISITKSGNEPAKIVVKEGKETWETTEDKLDKLPEKVRGYVEPMLGHHPSVGVIYGGGGGGTVGGAGGAGVMEHRVQPGMTVREMVLPGGNVEKRLDEMNRKIEQLQKAIQELQHPQPPRDNAPKAKAPDKKE
ncbi:MAG: PDZ domain-containing protein [Pirellulales bacterium]